MEASKLTEVEKKEKKKKKKKKKKKAVKEEKSLCLHQAASPVRSSVWLQEECDGKKQR